jgi:hypothetical protein
LHARPTLLQGTVDLLILKSLLAGEKHVLGVSRCAVLHDGGREFGVFGESLGTPAAQNTKILSIDKGRMEPTGSGKEEIRPRLLGNRAGFASAVERL